MLAFPRKETRVATNEKPELPQTIGDGFGRRELLQGLFAGVGATVALPIAGEHVHVTAPALAEAQAKANAPDWKAEFLDPHAFATLGVLCARIVPGSEKTGTDRFIDSLLVVSATERSGRFLQALGALERASLERFQQPFKGLGEAQQIELLTAASNAESSRRDWIWKPGEVLKQPERTGEPEALTLRDHFDVIKGWIVDSYYSSDAGLKELGSTGQMFFTTFPDCTHPEHT